MLLLMDYVHLLRVVYFTLFGKFYTAVLPSPTV
eukprot:COSAG06_NODE_46509_length_346_cov_0.842105_1_plen_32_part_10